MKVPETVELNHVRVMQGSWTVESVMEEVVAGGQEDPFYVMDLGEVVARYQRWVHLMPRVTPYYAVKCNDDKLLLSTLAALGTGFDCASKTEIERVTSLGVHPERIIFANPAKMSSHIRRAAALGVDIMTFDSEIELQKIKQLMPDAQLVIRIRCDAESAQCPLGMKFGCDARREAPILLKLAAIYKLNVIGVSFHVGSGAGEFGVYERAITTSRALFTYATDLGHNMSLLDIGGGFPGGSHTDILQVSEVINGALEVHFPSGCGVRVIAEPGRYFAAAAYTLATMLHSIREIPNVEDESAGAGTGASTGEKHTMYFVNDGVYGSFNCILYDHQHVTTKPLKELGTKPITCSIWGPSCDGLDCILPAVRLPAQPLGAWLVWPDMGAYTLPVASPFNGFPVPTVKYIVDTGVWELLKDTLPLSSAEFSPLPPPIHPLVSPPPSPPAQDPPFESSQVFIECALK